MATIVKIKEREPGGQLSREFYYNVDQIIHIFPDKYDMYFYVQDGHRYFEIDKENLDIILNACNVVN